MYPSPVSPSLQLDHCLARKPGFTNVSSTAGVRSHCAPPFSVVLSLVCHRSFLCFPLAVPASACVANLLLRQHDRKLAIRSAKRAPRAVFYNCSSDDLAVLAPTQPRWSLRPRHGHDLPSHSSMSCQHRHRLVTVLHHLDIPCRDPSNKRTSLCNFLVMSSACFATRGRVTLFLRYMIEVIVLLRHLCTLDVTFALQRTWCIARTSYIN